MGKNGSKRRASEGVAVVQRRRGGVMVVMRKCLDGGVVVWWLRSVGCGEKIWKRLYGATVKCGEKGEKVT